MAPNIQILGSKKHIFAPSGQFEPHRSMFSTRKRCLIGIPIWGYQNFYSLPPKNWILGPKTAKFGSKLAFCVNYVWMSLLFTLFSAHPCSNNKIMFEYTYSRFCDSQLFADGKLLPHLQNKSYLWDKAGNLFMVVGVQLHVVSVAGVHLQKRIFWKAKKKVFFQKQMSDAHSWQRMLKTQSVHGIVTSRFCLFKNKGQNSPVH